MKRKNILNDIDRVGCVTSTTVQDRLWVFEKKKLRDSEHVQLAVQHQII